MGVGFHLRVGNGNVHKPAGRGFPWFKREITGVFLRIRFLELVEPVSNSVGCR